MVRGGGHTGAHHMRDVANAQLIAMAKRVQDAEPGAISQRGEQDPRLLQGVGIRQRRTEPPYDIHIEAGDRAQVAQGSGLRCKIAILSHV